MVATATDFKFLSPQNGERAQFALSRCGADVANKETWQGAVTTYEFPGDNSNLNIFELGQH